MEDGVMELLEHISSFCLARGHLIGKWVLNEATSSGESNFTTCFDVISFLENVKWKHVRGIELVSAVVAEHCKLHRDVRGSDPAFVAFVGLALARDVFRTISSPTTVAAQPIPSAKTIAARQSHLAHVCAELRAVGAQLTCTVSPAWAVPKTLVVSLPAADAGCRTQTDVSAGQSWFHVGQQLAEAVLSKVLESTGGAANLSIEAVRDRLVIKTRVLSSSSAQVFKGVAVVEEPGAPQWFVPVSGVLMENLIRIRHAVLVREWGDDLTAEPISGFFEEGNTASSDDRPADLIIVQCSVSRAHIAAAEGRAWPTVLIGNIGQESMYKLAMATRSIPNARGRPFPPHTVLRPVPRGLLALRFVNIGCDQLHADSRHSSRAHKVVQVFVEEHVPQRHVSNVTVLVCSTAVAGVSAILSSFWACLFEKIVLVSSPDVVPAHGLVECCWIAQCERVSCSSKIFAKLFTIVANRCLVNVLSQYLSLVLEQSGSLSSESAEGEIRRAVAGLQSSSQGPVSHDPASRLYDVLVPRPPLMNCAAPDDDRCETDDILLADVQQWDAPVHRLADLRAAIDLCCVLCTSRILAFTTSDGVCVF